MSRVNDSPASINIGSRVFQRGRYRVGQFWRGLNARVSPEERKLAEQILPPAALALFNRLPADAQRHSLDVLRAVRAMGVNDPDLDAAALLHDVGKLAADNGDIRLGLWLRGPLVLWEAWSPQTLRRIGDADPTSGWRYTAYVHLEHPRIGAEWASRAGCSDLTCWLIQHHQHNLTDVEADDYGRRLLAVLQAADNSS